MNDTPGAYRRPRGRRDFRLVDAGREGTYWQSPDGVIVRLASGERGRTPARDETASPAMAFALLLGRLRHVLNAPRKRSA